MSRAVELLVASLVAASTLFLAPAELQATPFGTFTIVGTGNVRVSTSFVDWGFLGPTFESATYPDCALGPNPGACVIDGTTTGSSLVTSGTGSFAGLAGTGGTLLDLEDDFAPVASPFALPNFLTLAALPGVSLTATVLPLGSGTPAGCTSNPGDVCTTAGSPFTITNISANSAILGLSVMGTASDGVDLPSQFVGVFSTSFDTLSAAGILSQIATNGFVESSFSANFSLSPIPVTPIPEPSSVILFGTGSLLLLAGVGFRRRAKH